VIFKRKMCKKTNYKTPNTRIDKCMREFIKELSYFIALKDIKACCCGHGKYPMTLLVRPEGWNATKEMFSGKWIERKKRFYKRDKQGYYFIPEVSKEK